MDDADLKLHSDELEATLGSPDQTDTITLQSFQGQIVVLYFYPRDNTPGCTQQGQDFAAHYQQFKDLGAEVIGVSRDTLKSHQKFVEKHGLSFPLIADPEEKLCNAFGVMKDKNMYGKKVRGIERSTFLFDASGQLIKSWRKVKIPSHVEEVLAAVQELV